MCGIAGIYRFDKKNIDKKLLGDMAESIAHRGPDNSGMYNKDHFGVIHRLLKIQDLTEKSYQPIESKSFVMAYNGEIYNFQKIKKQLEKENVNVNSEGDTEVLLCCFEKYGIDKTLEIIDGCFAIALYDKEKDELKLIRDRMGVKPLYYYSDSTKFSFGSEIKAILQDKEIRHVFNVDTVLLSFMCKLWMPLGQTLFKGIYMIEPGTMLTVNSQGIRKEVYYKTSYNMTKYLSDDEEIKARFDSIFTDSVNEKLISKVPVAAFLSGGIDSSLICKKVVDLGKQDLNSYTVTYEYDENLDFKHAEEMCEKEKIELHETRIMPKDYSIENLDKVIYSVEEFLIDKVYLSVFFNYLAAKKDGYTVVLNGQGADENWLGYLDNWGIFKIGNNNLSDKELEKVLVDDYYMPSMIFGNKLKEEYIEYSKCALREYLTNHLFKNRNKDLLNDYLIMSCKTILHDLLMQEDKLAMAHSVESRVPFVDHKELVEFAFSISGKTKIKDGREKYVLRKYGEGMLPDSITCRKKLPFKEPPKEYNQFISGLVENNQEEIKNSKLLTQLIKKEWLERVNDFSPVEKWWVLVCVRFEQVFEMEVCI